MLTNQPSKEGRSCESVEILLKRAGHVFSVMLITTMTSDDVVSAGTRLRYVGQRLYLCRYSQDNTADSSSSQHSSSERQPSLEQRAAASTRAASARAHAEGAPGVTLVLSSVKGITS
jgi:hypothetical protein